MHSEGIVHAFRIVKALDFLGLGVDRVHTRAGNEQLTGDWVNLDFARMLDSLLVPFLVRVVAGPHLLQGVYIVGADGVGESIGHPD